MAPQAWTGAAFHSEVRSWVGERLDARGIRLTGEWSQPHARPWSSAIRLGTSAGPVWFKVNGAGTRHEPALLQLLGERLPGLVPEVLAVALDRGWSLTGDAGPLLRAVLPASESWAPWEAVAREYAAAQVELSEARGAVLATGVAEVSPTTIPGLARELVAELGGVPMQEGGLTGEQSDRLGAALSRLDAWCAELAASPLPDSVEHGDLHSANVCWSGSAASARILDWGDTTWGTPLVTLLTTQASLARHAGVPLGSAPVIRVRDAYLEPFTTYADRAELVRLAGLAARTGCVSRALAWRAALQGVPRAGHGQWGFPVRVWLLDLLA